MLLIDTDISGDRLIAGDTGEDLVDTGRPVIAKYNSVCLDPVWRVDIWWCGETGEKLDDLHDCRLMNNVCHRCVSRGKLVRVSRKALANRICYSCGHLARERSV